MDDAEKRIINFEGLQLNVIELCEGSTQELSKELVEKGHVLKSRILQTAKCEVSLLTLFPGSKIKEHTHFDDREYYIIPEEERYEYCSKGEKHSIENQSINQCMFIISVKLL